MKKKLAVILGPTATGKSHCGIALAKALDGEIISGDSMLVYRGMDIGTAKPTAEELAAVPHHMVDILPPEASFNVVDFKERAERLIDEVTARGRLPITSKRCLKITILILPVKMPVCARNWKTCWQSRAKKLCLHACKKLRRRRQNASTSTIRAA